MRIVVGVGVQPGQNITLCNCFSGFFSQFMEFPGIQNASWLNLSGPTAMFKQFLLKLKVGESKQNW